MNTLSVITERQQAQYHKIHKKIAAHKAKELEKNELGPDADGNLPRFGHTVLLDDPNRYLAIVRFHQSVVASENHDQFEKGALIKEWVEYESSTHWSEPLSIDYEYGNDLGEGDYGHRVRMNYGSGGWTTSDSAMIARAMSVVFSDAENEIARLRKGASFDLDNHFPTLVVNEVMAIHKGNSIVLKDTVGVSSVAIPADHLKTIQRFVHLAMRVKCESDFDENPNLFIGDLDIECEPSIDLIRITDCAAAVHGDNKINRMILVSEELNKVVGFHDALKETLTSQVSDDSLDSLKTDETGSPGQGTSMR